SDAGTLLIVSPWFSYPEGDIQLFEEIAQKDRLIKTIISNYFMSYTKSDLISKGEKKIKEELRDQINDQLVLGKINSVYFDQYIFFDAQK
ncbi:MAG: flagellar basal body-associated FliL family protein, partial [Treponema sp.]|nr:flagellar basal body-associated FliL family protein [Treponema sp.]